MSPSLKMRHGLMIAALGGVLLFQNCTSAPEESTLTSAGNSSSSSDYQTNLPLAVDGQLDTIAYMSCSEIKDSVERRTYFTFRAGAYSSATGGLWMRNEFRDKTKFYTVTERARSFSNSDANGDTRYSLSIRSEANYQQPWISEDLRVGEEIEGLLPPLDAAVIAGPIAALPAPAAGQAPAKINYFPGPHEKRLIEGSLRFYKFENVMKETRDKLEGGGATPGRALLVAGFSNGSDELNTALRSPPGATASGGGSIPVYGRGYYVNFRLPAVAPAGGERRVLASVSEVDVSVSPPQPTNALWDCNTNYQFMVVRPEDKKSIDNPNGVDCDAIVDRYDNQSEQQMLTAIRRVLRVEDWFVDLKRRCVIPKRTGDFCYGAGIQGRPIQYGNTSCVNGTGSLCPHYVSVCLRR